MKTRTIRTVILAALLLCSCLAAQVYNATTGRYHNSASGVAQKTILGSNYTNASTTFSNVGLSLSVSANTSYTLNCQLVYSGSATTAGPKFQFTGPASPTTVLVGVSGGTGAAAFADGAATAFSTAVTSLGTLGAASTNFVGAVTLSLVNGANAGTVQLQAAANSTGTLTILAGSTCRSI